MDMTQQSIDAAQTNYDSAPLEVTRGSSRAERWSIASFILPAVFIILFLSIFPLIISLYIAFSRLQFVRGGVQLTFVGFSNFQKLLFGLDQSRFLGKFGSPTLIGWLLLIATAAALIYWLMRYLVSGRVR